MIDECELVGFAVECSGVALGGASLEDREVRGYPVVCVCGGVHFSSWWGTCSLWRLGEGDRVCSIAVGVAIDSGFTFGGSVLQCRVELLC